MFGVNHSQNSLTNATGMVLRGSFGLPISSLRSFISNARAKLTKQVETLTSIEIPGSSISNETYFENNHGFKQAELLVQPIRRNEYTSPMTVFLSKNVSTPQLQQYRGFKTRRAIDGNSAISQKKREDSNNEDENLNLDFEKVQNLLKKSGQKTNFEELNKLLKGSDQKKTTASAIEASYAIGYAAGGQGKSESTDKPGKKFSIWEKLSKVATVLVIGVCSVTLLQALGWSGGRFGFGGATNEIAPEDIDVRFDDVKGCDEAKQELQDIVEFLMNPDKFSALGGKLPKGVLLSGPPGTGKTLLARAVAGQAGVPFFHAAGSEFDEVLVGQGARRVRDLFRAAKLRAPCVIFIDEVDSVGSKRTSSALHPYANQTINQLLSEMDGFRANEGIIVLGATNRPAELDKALLRPGRFDTKVEVTNPDIKGRKAILELYLSKVKYSSSLDVDRIAQRTVGFSGADLQNLVNTAAVRAAQKNREHVTMSEVEYAYDKQVMGTDLKSRVRDAEDIKITAYHEAGHTIVAYFTKDADPIHKVTIVAKGQSGGHTAFIKEKDQWHQKKSQLLAHMDVAMGGRIAEEMILGKERVTGGGSSDMNNATGISTAMVQQLGMSDKVGLRVFSADDLANGQCSDNTKGLIDEEVNILLNESYKRASTLLKNHQKEWKALAEALITYETLDSDEVKAIIDGKSLPKKQKPINGESITRDVSLNKSSLASPLGEPLVQ